MPGTVLGAGDPLTAWNGTRGVHGWQVAVSGPQGKPAWSRNRSSISMSHFPPRLRRLHRVRTEQELRSFGDSGFYCLLFTVRSARLSLPVTLLRDVRGADHLAPKGKGRAGPVVSRVEEAGGSRPKGKSRRRAVSTELPRERISVCPLESTGSPLFSNRDTTRGEATPHTGLGGRGCPPRTPPHPEQTARGASEAPTAACSGRSVTSL